MTDLLVPPDADTENDDEYTCTCGATHEDTYSRIMVGDEERCDDCASVCNDCGDGARDEDILTDSGGTYCDECRTLCSDCGDTVRHSDAISTGLGSYCTRCRFSCHNCGTPGHPDDAGHRSEWDSRIWCMDCCYYCDSCGETTVGSECDNGCYDGDIRGLRDYGHTYPSQWLGGPLPRLNGHHDGYYLGFEHEISASSGDAGVVNEWSCDTLSVDAFECKEDSSVEGFEIASQPMTRRYVEDFFAPVIEGYFSTLAREFGTPYNDEPDEHGLHVHISRTAFTDNKGNQSPTMLAAFCRILAADDGTHLERIGRREQTEYCRKVDKPVSSALLNTSSSWSSRRHQRAQSEGERRYQELVNTRGYEYCSERDRERERYNLRHQVNAEMGSVNLNRGAINLNNGSTVEIRSFKSTRKPENLLAALRLVSDAADYVRWLMRNRKPMSAKTTNWSAFCRWVAVHDPDMFDIVTGLRVLD